MGSQIYHTDIIYIRKYRNLIIIYMLINENNFNSFLIKHYIFSNLMYRLFNRLSFTATASRLLFFVTFLFLLYLLLFFFILLILNLHILLLQLLFLPCKLIFCKCLYFVLYLFFYFDFFFDFLKLLCQLVLHFANNTLFFNCFLKRLPLFNDFR